MYSMSIHKPTYYTQIQNPYKIALSIQCPGKMPQWEMSTARAKVASEAVQDQQAEPAPISVLQGCKG